MSDRVVTPRKKVTNRLRTIYPLNPTFRVFPRAYVRPVTESSFDSGVIDRGVWVNRIYYSPNSGFSFPAGVHRFNNSGLTSQDVFTATDILPYYSKLSPTSYKKEVEFLAKDLLPRNVPYIRYIYRITDSFVIDDYGRIYKEDPATGKYVWYQYTLSGEGRNKFVLLNNDGTSLSQTAYFFAGVAGYSPSLQNMFSRSGRFDFHHKQENKMDLRPSKVFPLETELHRQIHEEYTDPGHFFKLSKSFV